MPGLKRPQHGQRRAIAHFANDNAGRPVPQHFLHQVGHRDLPIDRAQCGGIARLTAQLRVVLQHHDPLHTVT
jgi:hypothetical protein